MTNKLKWGPGGCKGACCPHCPLGGTIRAAVRRHLYLSEQVVVVVVAAVAYSSFDATSILPPSETTSFSPPSLCDLLMWNSHNHRLRVQLLKFFQIELCTPYFPFTQMWGVTSSLYKCIFYNLWVNNTECQSGSPCPPAWVRAANIRWTHISLKITQCVNYLSWNTVITMIY